MAQKKFLQIESITSNDLITEMAKEVSKIIDAKIQKLHPTTTEDTFITRQEVAEMFSINLSTVHVWMNTNILKPYKIGNKTRFLLSEVKAAAIKTGAKKELTNG